MQSGIHMQVLGCCSAAPRTLNRAAVRLGPPLRRYLNTSTQARPFPASLAFAFDIDGVLKQGPNVLPQAKRVLAFLSGENEWNRRIPYLLMTNGGGVTDEKRRALLSGDLGQKLSRNQLVQSHTPLRSLPLISSLSKLPVLILGARGNACREVAESYGLQRAYIAQDVISWKQSVWPKTRLVEGDSEYIKNVDFSTISFAAIIVMHDSHDWGRDITLITELVQSEGGILGTRNKSLEGLSADDVEGIRRVEQEQMPLIFSNPDLEWQSDYPLPRYGQGAFRLAAESIYRAATERELQCIQLGKPHKATYDFAQAMLEGHARDIGRSDKDGPLSVYMVGDNPESDIAGAIAHGWSSLLLKTGVYRSGKPRFTPTTICDDVEVAVRWAVERESGFGIP